MNAGEKEMRAGLSSGAHLARILTGSTQGPGQPPPCLPLRSAKTRNNALQLSKIANARVIPEKNKKLSAFYQTAETTRKSARFGDAKCCCQYKIGQPIRS